MPRDAPIDHLHVRRHNLSVVLRLVASSGPCSRASIAGLTGLTRATVSSLVAELIERGLVRELGLETDQRVGRPATLLELDGKNVVTVGVEMNVGYTSVLGKDLAGNTVYQALRPSGSPTTGVSERVGVIVNEVRRAITSIEAPASERRVVGIGVAVPGITDLSTGSVVLAPNLGWRQVPLLELLLTQLGTSRPVTIDNEANMGAVAEYRAGPAAGTPHMVYVQAADGVGSGVIVNGSLFRGASGAAGEVGHITVDPDGAVCSCGRRGCWETHIDLAALLTSTIPDLAPSLLDDQRVGPEAKVALVVDRATSGDPIALQGLHEFGRWVGVGLANVVDAFNPEVIVLSGVLPALAPWTLEDIESSMLEHSLAESFNACRLVLSTFGFSAAALGCTLQASEPLFADPTLVEAT